MITKIKFKFPAFLFSTGQQNCRPNQQWTTCGTACPLTCSNYNDPPFCTAQCVDGCFCNDGYVQVSDKNTKCVLPENCP